MREAATIARDRIFKPAQRMTYSSVLEIADALRRGEDIDLPRSLARFEAACIAAALTLFAGSRTKTARRLGIGRSTLLRKLRAAATERGIRV